ncbi:MAG: type 4a pilus biogenesis protein PilO [Gemmatimonadota bacterium]
MPILPQDPKNQYRLLGIFLLLAAGALYYLYIHRPRGEDLSELRQRVDQIEQQNRLAKERMENLDAIRRQLELGERQFAMLERLVPARAEVPAIYEEIASESQALGLELVNVTPAEPLPDTAGYFLQQNWQMEVEGQYHDIGDFLTRVASLPRIVRPQVSEIRPTRQTPSGRQLVSARFGLETYVLPPPETERTEGGSE